MKLIEYFDMIRIISLPSRPDRRREVVGELARHGMSLEPGKVEFFDAIRPATDGGFASVGLHGCFLSHLQVLRESRAAGLSRVLILEDDFQLSRKFGEYQGAIVDQLRGRRWDLVYLGHRIATGPAPAPGLIPFGEHVELTHCYGVDGAIFDRFIAFLEQLLTRPPGHPDGGPMSPDGAITTFRARNPDVVTLIAAPSLCWQRSSRTDNHPLRWIDRAPVVRDLVGLARRVKVLIGSFR
jgi:hypothetical protein